MAYYRYYLYFGTKMNKKKSYPIIGAHLSIAKGLFGAIKEARSINANACQIFVKNGRTWKTKPLDEKVIAQYHATIQDGDPVIMVAHASYLINIASTNEETKSKSIDALIDELTRCDQLKIPYLVLHPGSHLGAGIEEGCKKVAESINSIFDVHEFSTTLLLETAAGQGTNLGSTFEELKAMIDMIKHKKNIGICLDTCHIHAAGYSLYPHVEYSKTMALFDEIVGMNHLKVIHLNNSKTERGSRKDRHEKLIKGIMPESVFYDFMQDEQLLEVPKILETPADKQEYLQEYKEELLWLRSL
ncbi:deoxyribonuclease IV [Candidatus Dependentiae bacterium]|nr:MAG: deoxyribonuclease IV [Candidatus Dependentiae bacterium]